MKDSVGRFTTRVENYARYRPTYPQSVVDLLKAECGLVRSSVVADIGSGTGILSELLLKNGTTVFGVEPNQAMRTVAERLLKDCPQFVSIEGAAESTTLESISVDFVTAAQAFHWFDGRKARREFARILRPEGWVVLIWNERRLDSSPFLRSYEELLLSFGTDYKQVRHKNVTEGIRDFFDPNRFWRESFENLQRFNLESLQGRVFSASYTPEPGHPNFEPMIGRLREIFDANQKNGQVIFEYDTTVYYGHLAAT